MKTVWAACRVKFESLSKLLVRFFGLAVEGRCFRIFVRCCGYDAPFIQCQFSRTSFSVVSCNKGKLVILDGRVMVVQKHHAGYKMVYHGLYLCTLRS